MNYVQGFVTPVPTVNKEKYRKQASDAAQLFKQFGVKRMVEGWGDDVPKGKVTDFQGAVQAKDDETVVFSWLEYPDKATYELANKKMRDDPRMKEMSFVEWPDKATRDAAWPKIMEDRRMQPERDKMPFDGQRMFWGGFRPILDK
jgi:uncharacterized protein YbaA (DUF1428 family)